MSEAETLRDMELEALCMDRDRLRAALIEMTQDRDKAEAECVEAVRAYEALVENLWVFCESTEVGVLLPLRGDDAARAVLRKLQERLPTRAVQVESDLTMIEALDGLVSKRFTRAQPESHDPYSDDWCEFQPYGDGGRFINDGYAPETEWAVTLEDLGPWRAEKREDGA